MRTRLFLSLSLSLVACGDDDARPVDGGSGVDTGTPVLPDGGGTDTGTTLPDGGGTDTGMSMGGMCPSGTCDLISNAGCDSAMGEGCYWGGREMGVVCAPAGAAAVGASCTNVNDCQEGTTCDDNVCRKICCGGSDANCDPGDLCVNFADEMGSIGFGACRTPSGCDALAQTGCAAGEACYPVGGDGTTDCARPSMGAGTTQGASCMFLNGCVAGFFCQGPEGGGQCSRLCDPMAMPDPCGEGLVCGRLGSTSLGGCIPRPAM